MYQVIILKRPWPVEVPTCWSQEPGQVANTFRLIEINSASHIYLQTLS